MPRTPAADRSPSPREQARALWDAFLLESAERRAAACAPSAGEEARTLARLGRERAEVADRLLEPHTPSALTMYRDAAVLLMAGFVAARTGEATPAPLRGDEVLARFLALEPAQALGGDADLRATFLDGVRAPDVVGADRLSPDQQLRLGRTARVVVRSLSKLVEPRSLPEIRFARRARLIALGVLVAVPLLSGAVSVATRRTNLALGKPVTASSVHDAATTPISGLTDGVKTGAYGAHTEHAPDVAQWFMVDLGDVYVVDTIKVYNRGDGSLQASLPLTLQVSEDGAHFTDVGTRQIFFGQQDMPWRLFLDQPQRARYVRVIGQPGKYVVLSELEVFGRRP
jgi:hypothetical protein